LSTVKSLLSIAVSTMYVRIHKFTGMVFDFTERKKLKMKKSLDDILKRNNITVSAVTPTTPDLFQIDDASPRLKESKAEIFHSEVASISYLVKRIKPECLTATSFLLIRVHYSTEQDWAELEQLLNYVNATKTYRLPWKCTMAP
jgi:hypothetical protein